MLAARRLQLLVLLPFVCSFFSGFTNTHTKKKTKRQEIKTANRTHEKHPPQTHLLFAKRWIFPQSLQSGAALLSPGVRRVSTHLQETRNTSAKRRRTDRK